MQKIELKYKYLILPLLTNMVILLSSFGMKEPSQLFGTSLQIIVRNELGNIEDNVEVTLFKSKESYGKSINAIASARTDKKGKIVFKNLEPLIYFIKAEKEQANNSGGGEQTTQLEANKMNKITLVISE